MVTGPHSPTWGFLLEELCQVPGITHALAVSGDGLVSAVSQGLPRDQADRLAAITSGLASLTLGLATMTEAAPVESTVVEMRGGFFACMAIGDGATLAVLAAKTVDLGQMAYEMSELINRMGPVLTPARRQA
jgi:predicted regulator of Ras-like GTPase activity (Roadblock/LC7/MglB family)